MACTTGKDSVSVESKITSDVNFDLISDFENNLHLFRADTFELFGESTDGGELIAFHTKNRDYVVVDAWIYGETGKLHTTFWTDRNLNIRLAQRTLYQYDRSYYEADFKTKETTEYFSFINNNFRLYDGEKRELRDGLAKKRDEIQKSLADLTKDIEIVK